MSREPAVGRDRHAAGARWGARSAVGAGFALLAAALAGAPLYVSAAGSEAVQLALASTCGADAGVRLGQQSAERLAAIW